MNSMEEAKSVVSVRDHLLVVFNKLRNGSMEPKDAVEINNTAGKILSSVKVQLAYHAMRGERPEIEFLNPMKSIENTQDAPKLEDQKS
jgi:hypothetical protein